MKSITARVLALRARWFLRSGIPSVGLARLQIPIAKFAPEKAIERLGGLAEIVFLQRLRDRADRVIEAQQDPFVVAGEERRIDFAFGLSAVHLAEARRVPELVGKVPALLDLLLIKTNVLPAGRNPHQTETQPIRPIFRDQVERIGRIA